MKNGGYQVLDLKEISLTSGTPETISGAFAALSGSNNKPILVSGLSIGGDVVPDFYCAFVVISDDYVGTTFINTSSIEIVVASDDSVTVTVS